MRQPDMVYHRSIVAQFGRRLAVVVIAICFLTSSPTSVRAGSIFDDNFKPAPDMPAKPPPQAPDEPPPAPRLPPAPNPAETPTPSPETTPNPSPAVPTSARLSIPAAKDVAGAEKLVKQVFANEYKVHTTAGKAALARALLNETGQPQDPLTLYVLLREARDLASSGGDADSALQAIRGLRDWFAISDKAEADMEHMSIMTAAAASTSSAPTFPPRPEIRASALALMEMAECDFAAGDFDSASQIAAQADQVARKSNEANLAERVHDRTAFLQSVGVEYGKVKPSIAMLKTNPADPAANVAVGKFFAVTVDRPDIGMPDLSRGNDPGLKSLATQELTPPTDAAGESALADGWAALIKTTPTGPLRDAVRRRAIHWYELAASHANGLEQITLQKKCDNLRALNLKRGLFGEYFRGDNFAVRAFTRVDQELAFNWGGHPPDPDIPGEFFSIRWSGFIKVAVPGTYQLVLIHDDGARVWLDGQLILDKWGGAGRDTVNISFSGSLQSLKVEYQQFGGDSNFGLGWIAPGAKKTQAIPSEMLYHDDRPAGPALELAQTWSHQPDGIALQASAALPSILNGIELGRTEGGRPDHTEGWGSLATSLKWEFFAPTGDYDLSISYACDGGNAGASYTVAIGNRRFNGVVEDSGGWSNYHQENLGRVHLTNGGQTLRLFATTKPHGVLMDLSQFTLTPVTSPAKQ